MDSIYVPIIPYEIGQTKVDPQFGYRIVGVKPIILEISKTITGILMIDTFKGVQMHCHKHTYFFASEAICKDEYEARARLDSYISLETVA